MPGPPLVLICWHHLRMAGTPGLARAGMLPQLEIQSQNLQDLLDLQDGSISATSLPQWRPQRRLVGPPLLNPHSNFRLSRMRPKFDFSWVARI